MNTLITLEVKFYSAVLCDGLVLGLETKDPRSWSWSRLSRPECQGLGRGLEFFKKVLTTTLQLRKLICVLRSLERCRE